jgi:hypothetical protein
LIVSLASTVHPWRSPQPGRERRLARARRAVHDDDRCRFHRAASPNSVVSRCRSVS